MSLPKEEIQKKILEELQKNPIISYACKQHGVARSTFYRWLEEDGDFKIAYKKATSLGKGTILDFAKLKLLKLMNSQDERIALETAKFYINKYDPALRKNNEKKKDIHEHIEEIQLDIVDENSEYLKKILEYANNNPNKLVINKEKYQREIERIIAKTKNSK